MQLLGKSHVSSSRNDFCILGHDYEVRSELKNMVGSSKLDASKLNLGDVDKAIKKRHPNNISVYYLREDSFDLLKSIGILITDDKLDPMAVRMENLVRTARSIMEESDSLFSPVDGLKNIGELLAKYHSTGNIQAVIDTLNDTGIRHLVGLLDHPSIEVLMAALRVVMYIVTGEDDQTQLIINNGALPCLLTLLSRSSVDVRTQTCFSISNITAGTVEQIQAVIDCDIISFAFDDIKRLLVSRFLFCKG